MRSRRWTTFVYRLRWLAVAIAAIMAISYIAFEMYVQSTARELVNGWLQNEALSLQQGNYLTAISKNQRLLLSSDFVRGISLVDVVEGEQSQLIRFGETIPSGSKSPQPGQIQVLWLSPFRHLAMYKFPESPRLQVLFLMTPKYTRLLFFVYALTTAILFALFSSYLVRLEKREARHRETLLKVAIDDFAYSTEPSPILVQAAPNLIKEWTVIKDRLKKSQEREIDLISSARFADLARQVAHDIRSPLSALSLVNDSEMPSERRLLLKGALDRITTIANSLLEKTRVNTTEDGCRSEGSIDVYPVNSLIEQVIAEKKIGRGSEILPEIDTLAPSPNQISILCQPEKFQSVLSNLLDNAIEATPSSGKITIKVSKYRTHSTVVIADTGRGIPANILPRLFEKGATFGKENGNGLGLYDAKSAVESWGGRLDLLSKEGHGTIVTVTFKNA